MFKQTRRKIVAAIMSILTVLFIGMLAVIYIFSYQETLKENLKMLQRHAGLYSLNHFMDDNFKRDDIKPDYRDLISKEPKFDKLGEPRFEDTPEYQLSAFYSVAIANDNSILATDNSKVVYTDEELHEIALKVFNGAKKSGTIGSLLYYKENKGGYTLIAFMDNSIMLNSINTLFKYTLVCGSITMILLFFLAIQLARRIVHPLEESYTKQKQFISDAGHELKTPVSIVNANAELLSREIGDNPWLSNIQYENERMGALVTQLLELARTEHVVPQMEVIDFSHLVDGEALPFESVAYEKGMVLTYDIEENLKVFGNTSQLRQITSILIDNAMNHAPEKSEMILTLKSKRNYAVLSVINEGDEIPLEQRKQLFERFYRADAARNGEDKHYGLGLAIAKAIVTAHKGKIEVLCYDGKVNFTVRIPLQKK